MDTKQALTKTKVGRRVMGFMVALNRGDEAHLTNYLKVSITDEGLEQQPLDEWVRELTNIYHATGGMRVFQVVATDEYKIVLMMQAHNNNAFYIMEVAIEEDFPHRIGELIHRPA